MSAAASSKVIHEYVGFIGGGEIAKAIAEGITKNGLVGYPQIYVSGLNIEEFSWWRERRANLFTENGLVTHQCAIVFLAVEKGEYNSEIAEMFESLPLPTTPKLFISIVSGIRLEKLENDFLRLGDSARVIRVMPNPPILIGESCSVLCPGVRASVRDIDLVKQIFSSCGSCTQVPESALNTIAAFTGSGVAFVQFVIEYLGDAGVNQGLPNEKTGEMAYQTALGAAQMVLDTGKHPAVLRDEICSVRDSAMAGIYALESGRIRASIFEAVQVSVPQPGQPGYQ